MGEPKNTLGTCDVCNKGCCNCASCIAQKGREDICRRCFELQKKEKEKVK